MLIGFDGSRAFVSSRTGTENYSFQLLKALSKIDRVNQYVVYMRPDVKAGEGWPVNFHFKEIPWPRFWTQGGLALQTFKDKLDVLFVPAHTLPLISKPGLKTVVTVHDLGSEYLPKTHQLKQRLYLSLMQKYQLKTATKLIAVSKATKQDLINKVGIKSSKVEVVYEGFDNKLFKPVNNDILIDSLKSFNLVPKSFFLFVGTVQPRKNLERVVIAFSRWLLDSGQKQKTNDQKLIIVGSKGWLSDDIYKLPKKLGIEDKVKFLGYVPEKDLPGLYSGAIALVFPSLFEGFGLPILEAQACGCPVITSKTSSMPEVAGQGAILVDPYSIDDIVKGMEQINNQVTRNKLVKTGLNNIKRFSWEKAARETLQVLENL